jgi:hypothetical protein
MTITILFTIFIPFNTFSHIIKEDYLSEIITRASVYLGSCLGLHLPPIHVAPGGPSVKT